MSAGISALGWAAILGATAVSATSADQSRKTVHAQQDALNAAQADDARQSAEAETAAQVAANAKLADAKRRRRASSLGMGDTSATPSGNTTLGGAPSVMATGGPSPASRLAAGAGATAYYGGTALGAGSTGRVTVPRPPTRGNSV